MAATPDGRGYWLVASDGGIFSFGDAGFYGSTGAITLNRPVVGMAATPDGRGYWLVASDGGIFSFGDARFYGSTGSIALNQPVVGMAATPDGRGYWLVAVGRRDLQLRGRPVPRVDRRASPSTGRWWAWPPPPTARGYWLVASDGGIFSFGRARFFGSEGGSRLAAPVVGMAASPDGDGYWLVIGSPLPLAGKVVGIDPGHNGLNGTAPQIIDQPVWNGQETESCDTTGTETAGGYTEALFNFNVATYLQADLQAEGARVVMTRPDNSGIGPCVTTRAAIINAAQADVAVDIHADGGPVGGRGFAILEPVADGPERRRDRAVGHLRHHPPGRVSIRDGYAGEHLRRRRRPATSQRPGRAQPDHGPQGSHRVRQHAEPDRRGDAGVAGVPTIGRVRPWPRPSPPTSPG